tara:strand:- start:11934 stop:12986 length:1053 start_codon:yes stop_codon:yes gene_type:complete
MIKKHSNRNNYSYLSNIVGKSKESNEFLQESEKVAEMLSSLMSNVGLLAVAKTEQLVSSLIVNENRISFESVECDTISISGINLKNEVDVEEHTNLKTEFKADLSSKIASEIVSIMLGISKDGGSTLEGMLGATMDGMTDISEDFTNMVADMFSIGEVERKNSNTVRNIVKTSLTADLESKIESEIDSETFQQAFTDILNTNVLEYGTTNCKVLNMEDINFENSGKILIEKVLTSNITLKISKEIISQLEDATAKIDIKSGDAEQLGDAIAKNIEAMAEAADRAITAMGESAAAAIEAAGEAASAPLKYLVFGCVAIAVACICMVMIWFMMSGSKPDEIITAGANAYSSF